ncbi:DedA family protein [Crassaminicella thermophila]|uniref:DedA family protein n=1 Tax=Crassaminicella thermophila TaxID=2599308 RepID=A0A5C0S9L5_CRATE|nr:DedA family protein [Crassaminicella thermophila]QEK11355.1 DedA family protein [Crassaminicella thermophila]
MLQEKILLLISMYGYIGIFLALVLGIIGLPIPDEVLLTFAGFLVSKGKMDYFLLILVSFIGSVAGVSISFFIGYHLGLPFLLKYGRILGITKKSLNKAEKWYNKYGKYTIVIGYFIPGIRQLNAYYAGIIKKPYWKFAFYAYIGGFIWVMIFVTLGIYVGERWMLFSHIIHKFALSVLVLICICFCIYYIVKNVKIKKI